MDGSQITSLITKIDRLAIAEIEGITGIVYEYADANQDSENMRLITLGEVSGVLRFAKTLKQELRK
jgi:hypothetical protein